VAGDDLNEPVSDEVRSILDGHIVLSNELARQHHYPAIDLLSSISRVLPAIVEKKHLDQIALLREVLSNYKKNELLIRIGEYKPGSDKNADFAIRYIDKVNQFLKQKIEEKSSFEQTLQQLFNLFR
jgi:type III secretion protein N (ATPase)